MTDASSADLQLDEAVLETVQGAKVVLTITDAGREPANVYGRRAAALLAARLGATLVLFDRAGETWGDTPSSTGVIDLARVEAAGRDYLVEQMREAQALGVSEVRAWGNTLPAFEALGEAVEHSGAEVVVIPDHLERPSLGDRWRMHGDGVARVKEQAAGRHVVVVTPDGRMTLG